jgi:hypothetical protein
MRDIFSEPIFRSVVLTPPKNMGALNLASHHQVAEFTRLPDYRIPITLEPNIRILTLIFKGQPSGLKWREIEQRPEGVEPLTNKMLSDALQTTTTFTVERWAEFGITGLKETDFIEVGDKFFQPDHQRFDEKLQFWNQESLTLFKENLFTLIPQTSVAGIFEFRDYNAKLPMGHACAFAVERNRSGMANLVMHDSADFFGQQPEPLDALINGYYRNKEIVTAELPTDHKYTCTGITLVCDPELERTPKSRVAGLATNASSPVRRRALIPPVTPLRREPGPTPSRFPPEGPVTPMRRDEPGGMSLLTPSQFVFQTPVRAELVQAAESIREPQLSSQKPGEPHVEPDKILYNVSIPTPETRKVIGNWFGRNEIKELRRMAEETRFKVNLDAIHPKDRLYRQSFDMVFYFQTQLNLLQPPDPKRKQRLRLKQNGMWCWLFSNAYLGLVCRSYGKPLLKSQDLLYNLYEALLKGDRMKLDEDLDALLINFGFQEDVVDVGTGFAGGWAWRFLMHMEREMEAKSVAVDGLVNQLEGIEIS